MRRGSLTLGVSMLLFAAMLSPGALAQDASPGLAAHPLVGTWIVDTNTADDTNAPSTVEFHADGTYLEVDVDGVSAGAWEPAGPQTATLTFVFRGTDESGAPTSGTVRADVEVAADGQSLTATYTVEFAGPDGTPTGQLGPGEASGTRLKVEPMGSPVAPLQPPSSAAPSMMPGAGSPDASMMPAASPAG
jgi:hypothetical protein